MAPSPILEEHARDSDSVIALVARFESMQEFRSEFSENISRGVLFLPTVDAYEPHQIVDVMFDLAFCSEQVIVAAEVVAIVDPALAAAGATPAGISVRFSDSTSELRKRLEELTGLILSQPGSGVRAERRTKARTRTDADVVVATEDGEFPGTTANISYAGVLALLPMTSIPVGTAVCVHLANPTVELGLTVDGRVIHSRRCDGGMIAHGIQLHYPVERIDEVMSRSCRARSTHPGSSPSWTCS
jgi:Tfp pilus assembly protein PilZ